MTTNWVEGDVTLSAMSMHYARSGGSKPALILAHGFSDNGMCWLPAAEELAADYDVILPDAKGHGKSSRVMPGETAHRDEDLAEFITALGLKPPIVGGHSMGGITASALGAHHPELVSALILEDPAWIERRPEPPVESTEENPWLKELRVAQTVSVEKVMAMCRKQNPLWADVELRPWALSKQELDLNVFTVKDALFDVDWKDIARRIGVPTLLITAEVDKGAIISPENAQKARELNPLIHLAHVPGAGHNIRRENYGAYMDAVHNFLRLL